MHIQPANQPWRKYVCVCISICTSLSLSPSLSLLIYIYVLPNIPQHQLTKQFLPFCFTSLSSRHVLSPANMFEQYVLLNYLCLWGTCSIWTWTLAFHSLLPLWLPFHSLPKFLHIIFIASKWLHHIDQGLKNSQLYGKTNFELHHLSFLHRNIKKCHLSLGWKRRSETHLGYCFPPCFHLYWLKAINQYTRTRGESIWSLIFNRWISGAPCLSI